MAKKTQTDAKTGTRSKQVVDSVVSRGGDSVAQHYGGESRANVVKRGGKVQEVDRSRAKAVIAEPGPPGEAPRSVPAAALPQSRRDRLARIAGKYGGPAWDEVRAGIRRVRDEAQEDDRD